MRKYTPLIIVPAALLIAVGLVLLAMRRPPPPPGDEPTPAAATAPASKPMQALDVQGAQVEQRDKGGKLEWKVTAGGQLQVDRDQQTATGQKVRFEIMQAGKPGIVVKAESFKADYLARKLTFADGVSGQLIDGSSRFSVKRLEYDLGTKKLLGSGGATYQQGAYTASAPELVLDTRHKKVRLKGGVRFSQTD